MFERFGIEYLVSSLAIPAMEVVFGNDAGQNFILKREMKRFHATLFHYPFGKVGNKYKFKRIQRAERVETLWHSFIDSIMSRRHSIAHGDVTENVTTWEGLASDVGKLHILMHGLAYSAAAFFTD